MPLTFHPTLQPVSWLRHKVSAAFLLQSAACAVVAWSVLHGGLALAPAERPATGDAGTGPTAAPAPGTPGPATSLAETSARGVDALPASLSRQLAGAPGLAEAQLALSTIDVIVTRNDTLDRIFRRLKLNLADLTSLRTLPGLRARLDSLRPGEALRFIHRDGQLFGLERRRSEEHTSELQSRRDLVCRLLL